MRLKLLALTLPLVALPGCNILEGGDCTTQLTWMLKVSVTGPGGAPVAGGYTLAVYSASVGDSLVQTVSPQEAAGTVFVPDAARPSWGEGRYSVEIRAPGYQTWRRDQIEVDEDNCGHTSPEQVQAVLVPVS
jgi:hypothetical protein